jgi:uncharacterized membrane protein
MKKNISLQKVSDAIADFEDSVNFEFVPVISMKSSYTEHIAWVISLLFLLIFIGLIDFVFKAQMSDSWMSLDYFYIAAPFLAFVSGFILDKSDTVDRFFISKAERARQVQQMAEYVFFKSHLAELKSQNALLLYISVMERKIVLFPDPRLKFEHMREINQELLQILQQSFKREDFEEGLLKAIAHLKQRLAPHYGYAPGVTKGENTVPNKLIWWKA